LGQILSTLLSHALKNTTIDHVFVEATFNSDMDQDDIGELQVVISDSEKSSRDSDTAQSVAEADERNTGIGLSISKGLAACMGGSVNLMENKERGNRIFLSVKLQVVSHEEKRFGSEQKLRGKRALLIDLPESTALALGEELSVWGIQVQISSGHDTSLQRLEELTAQAPVDVVVIYTKLNSMSGMVISRDIATHESYKDIKQVLVMSVLPRDTAEMKAHLRQYSQVSCIEKPVIRKRLYDVLLSRLVNGVEEEVEVSTAAKELSSVVNQPRILLVDDHRVDQMVISAMLKKMGCYVQVARNGA